MEFVGPLTGHNGADSAYMIRPTREFGCVGLHTSDGTGSREIRPVGNIVGFCSRQLRLALLPLPWGGGVVPRFKPLSTRPK